MSAPQGEAAGAALGGLFARVVCGVDDSEEGLVAARLAARVTDPRGALELLSIVDRRALTANSATAAERALALARTEVGSGYAVETRTLEGRAIDVLLAELERRHATLVVVGSRGHSRPTGIVLGSVTTFALHEAPCSVLVARRAAAPDGWPASLVVGVDGSPSSAAALDAARTLATRFGSRLRAIAATGDPRLDVARTRALAADVELHDARPIDALTFASEGADLVVVGSRGLRGVRALASVSERVAHEARSSVLVVR